VISDAAMTMPRHEIASLILRRLGAEKLRARGDFSDSSRDIGRFIIDDLLPEDLAIRIHDAFPSTDGMRLNKSLRELKYVSAQMDRHDPLLEEVIYAFQDRRIVELIQGVCGIDELVPDQRLYAGGISLMAKGHFLNPHLDNSHDNDRQLWRVLNLLYYVTPGWEQGSGGNLELWPGGPRGDPVTIVSRFNRLVVMATHEASWHSVSPVIADVPRCCVSNYYFSPRPLRDADRFHVTSFRGRPEQRVRDWWLRADTGLRMGLRRIFSRGVRPTTHIYQRDDT